MNTRYKKYLIFLLATVVIPLIAKSQDKLPFEVTIDTHGVSLNGSFYVVEEKGSFPILILIQGYTTNDSDVSNLGKYLAQSGINVLTFNTGRISPGEGLKNLNTCLANIQAAYTFVRNPENIVSFKIDTTSVVLGGISYEGGLAMTYSIKHPEIKHVISISGIDLGEYFEENGKNPLLKAQIDDNGNRFISTGIVKFEIAGQPSEIHASGHENIDPNLYLKRNAKLLAQKDILLFCGWDDSADDTERYILPLYRELQKENAEHVKIVTSQDNQGYGNSYNEMDKIIMDWIKNIPNR